jgi:hypothetical protein
MHSTLGEKGIYKISTVCQVSHLNEILSDIRLDKIEKC